MIGERRQHRPAHQAPGVLCGDRISDPVRPAAELVAVVTTRAICMMLAAKRWLEGAAMVKSSSEAGDGVSLARARDLLMPHLHKHDPEAELWVDNLDNTLIHAKTGTEPKAVLKHAELANPKWKELVEERLGWASQCTGS